MCLLPPSHKDSLSASLYPTKPFPSVMRWGNLIIVKSLECLLEVQFPVFVHTAVRHFLPLWGSFPHLRSSDLTERPFLCCSTGMLSTLVNKTLLRPHLLEPFHILRWCAVWTLFCVTLPWVVCVCPLSRTAALPAGS